MTMTKEEVAKEIKECEMKLKNLREELNKPKYGGKRWKPGMGQRYWLIGIYGYVVGDKWDNHAIDNQAFNAGNAFPSEEAAKFELERRKVLAELSDYAEGDDAVWDRMKRHYLLCYDPATDHVKYDFNQSVKYPGLYFPSEEAAKAAVEAVGEGRVKKYYLGVKE